MIDILLLLIGYYTHMYALGEVRATNKDAYRVGGGYIVFSVSVWALWSW